MTGDGALATTWSAVRGEPSRDDDATGVVGWLQRLCRAATVALPAQGTGISVVSTDGDVLALAASSPASALVEELQFTVGEGPCADAMAWGRPVLVSDLAAVASRWPGYVPPACAGGVAAVFAFPLRVGAAQLGALDVYREHTGALTATTLQTALRFADVALELLLGAQGRPWDDPTAMPFVEESAFDGGTLLWQAQGMVMVQLGVSVAEAMARLRAYAYAHDRRLGDVARDVVDRRLSFEADDAPKPPQQERDDQGDQGEGSAK